MNAKFRVMYRHKVFIQKGYILSQDKAVQGFSPQSQSRLSRDRGWLLFKPQAQTRGERRIGTKDAVYEWTLAISEE
jgi:hypothetical protein